MKTLHFKSKQGYQKYLAYGHIHGDFARVPGYQNIMIGGKKHKVNHSMQRIMRGIKL